MLYVVLDRAPLELTKVGGNNAKGNIQLLCSEDHQGILRKNHKDLAEYRPDILHQCLMTLLDSPLNKAGKLRIWIRSQRNVLIEVNPRLRIPRTWTRFAGLMTQLLQKLSIRATSNDGEGTGEVLMNVIKNPLEQHLPANALRVALSEGYGEKVRFDDFIRERHPQVLQADKPVVVWIGAVAKGKDEFQEVKASGGADCCELAISDYALSASVVCGKVCEAMERIYGIF